MNSYPSYKDSGVEWLGDIPNDWDSIRLKYIGFLYGGLSGKSGKDFNDDGNPNNKPFIPFTNISDNTYISRDNLGKVNISEDDKQNRVKQFDLFFLMSSEDQEGIGKPSVLKEELGEVYLNTFCRGFRITDEKYDSLFVNYLLSGHSYRELLSVEGRGFTRINLRSHKVSNFQIYYPPKETQTQIVSFLDTKTNKIDELIEKTQQKIELLKEKRTSLINHCVTKGLNPDVEMKDSGVEWIGEIPSHWETSQIKFVTQLFRGKFSHRPRNDQRFYNGEYPFIQTGDIVSSGKYLTNYTQTLNEKGYSVSKEFPLNTLVMTISGNIGDVSILKIKSCFPDSIIGFFPFKNTSVDFLYFVFSSLKNEFYKNSTISTQMNLNIERVGSIKVPLLPKSEQTKIVEYLDEQTQKIDSTIEKETQRTELLKEYRQSLISEVVTGKVDVRNYNG